MAGTVYPVFNNKFKIKIGGEATPIAEVESFGVAIDGNTEEWKPFEDEGWTKRLVTGKSLTVSIKGKRCVGDPGNDYVAGLAFKTGVDCNSEMEWEMPSGAKLNIPCVISVTNPGGGDNPGGGGNGGGGGDSTAVDGLEFDALSNGKPTFTPAPTAARTVAAKA